MRHKKILLNCHPERPFVGREGPGRADSRRCAKGALPYFFGFLALALGVALFFAAGFAAVFAFAFFAGAAASLASALTAGAASALGFGALAFFSGSAGAANF